ncbi:MAG: hypothetical protein KGZ79_10605 [Dethiobacter sp.]|jgi:hypothetical protein|nr:hypothetical protein [Dethiobacter sp.]
MTRNFSRKTNEKNGEKLPNICTLFTKDYLIQGLALYYSLKKYTPRFRLWVLCVDNTAYNMLKRMNLADITLVRLEHIRDERLAKIQRDRQKHEFCWTLKASFVTYLFNNNFNLDSLLYLDADLFFFKDVRAIYTEWADHSIFLTRQWLSPGWQKKAGRYSSGLIGFKRDENGMKCLRLWRRKCLNWCYDRRENGLWGDQKYLDDWPRLFSNIKISDNKGINAGPWNINKGYEVHTEGGNIYFDNRQLICYHFSGFEIITEHEFELCNRKRLSLKAEKIYCAYLEELREIIALIKSIDINYLQRTTKKKRRKLFNHRLFLKGKRAGSC